MARTKKKSVIEQGLLFSAPLTQEALVAGADEAGRGSFVTDNRWYCCL